MAGHAHLHAHAHEARAAQPDVSTYVSVVYVTASPTFSGAIGGYSTVQPGDAATTHAAASAGGPNFYAAGASSAASSAAPTANAAAVSPSSSPVSQVQQSTYHIYNGPPTAVSSSAAAPTTFVSSVVPAGSVVLGAPMQNTRSSSSISSIPTVAVAAAVQTSSAVLSSSAAPSSASASATLNKPNAAAAAATNSSDADATGMTGGAKGGLAFGIIVLIALVMGAAFFFYRKRQAKSQGMVKLDDEKSPFSDHAAAPSRFSMNSTAKPAPRLSLRPVTDMFPEMSEKRAQATNPFSDEASSLSAKNGPGPVDFTPSPDGLATPKAMTTLPELSAAAVTPIETKRATPPGMAPMNVHRVQLDFNPSMEDELELKAGQLVRLLHEYDDGWALCKRLDRSQQGVVPRTCLSRLPVKPRPAGPPPPGMRAMPPAGRPRQPSSASSSSSSPRKPVPGMAL